MTGRTSSSAYPKCPACGSGTYRILWEKNGLTYGRCDACTLAYNHPLLPDDHPTVRGANSIRTEDEYNENMLHSHDRRVSVAKPLAHARVRFYSRVMGRKPAEILDVGCGDGALYEGFKECGVQWTGVDVNPTMVEFAQRHNIPVRLQDFMQMDPGKQYDVIFLSQVLEHVLDPNGFLSQTMKLLTSGGLLHLDVPNHNSLTSTLRKLWPRGGEFGFLQPPYHLIAYTSDSLLRLLSAHKYKVVILHSFSNYHSLFGQTHPRVNPAALALFWISEVLHMGSLLVAVAIKEND